MTRVAGEGDLQIYCDNSEYGARERLKFCNRFSARGIRRQRNAMNKDERVRDETERTAPLAEAAIPARTAKNDRRRWPLLMVGGMLGVPLLALIAWTMVALSWSYSKGDRAGFIQKFSQKGWICKTWEGDLAMVTLPGAVPERFPFSVRDDSLAREIPKLMGSRVSITYEEHRGVPGTCFGETDYFVTGIKAIP